MYEDSHSFTVTAEQRSMVVYLSQAGFSEKEISNCFTLNLTEVQAILAEENSPPNTDVA
ncbi:MAG: hypothetical protein K0U86_05285 [Planctomycetes bacterium]|nr:hypothetical protein [Planctomycetota bacterium]MCH9724302.1 hypothetical protein [Planctomycetota bacterium]MCH9777321.1 hypothetical protein [Planctomycetota bacterium]MCH9791239.1 hypothetical protein [Planctomycetota bacterium]